ncbi:MAG: hypothetical protein WDW38_005098 [Sanguina aurantia]
MHSCLLEGPDWFAPNSCATGFTDDLSDLGSFYHCNEDQSCERPSLDDHSRSARTWDREHSNWGQHQTLSDPRNAMGNTSELEHPSCDGANSHHAMGSSSQLQNATFGELTGFRDHSRQLAYMHGCPAAYALPLAGPNMDLLSSRHNAAALERSLPRAGAVPAFPVHDSVPPSSYGGNGRNDHHMRAPVPVIAPMRAPSGVAGTFFTQEQRLTQTWQLQQQQHLQSQHQLLLQLQQQQQSQQSQLQQLGQYTSQLLNQKDHRTGQQPQHPQYPSHSMANDPYAKHGLRLPQNPPRPCPQPYSIYGSGQPHQRSLPNLQRQYAAPRVPYPHDTSFPFLGESAANPMSVGPPAAHGSARNTAPQHYAHASCANLPPCDASFPFLVGAAYNSFSVNPRAPRESTTNNNPDQRITSAQGSNRDSELSDCETPRPDSATRAGSTGSQLYVSPELPPGPSCSDDSYSPSRDGGAAKPSSGRGEGGGASSRQQKRKGRGAKGSGVDKAGKAAARAAGLRSADLPDSEPEGMAEDEEPSPVVPKARAPRSKRRGTAATSPVVGVARVFAPNPNGTCCSECGTQSTPVWRHGPSGPKTLCNACGVRHMKIAKKRSSDGSR